jgi:hypothetical protein
MTVPLVFGLAGDGCAIAFLISTITILLVALNVNQFARISASPGSLYTYITDHMHPRFGVLAGWALLIAYVGTAAAVSAGVTNYANVDLAGSLRRASISVAIDRAGDGVRVLSGLSRRANFHAPHAVAGGGIGGSDFRGGDRHHREARLAPGHRRSSRCKASLRKSCGSGWCWRYSAPWGSKAPPRSVRKPGIR